MGKTDLTLVTLRGWRLKPSMAYRSAHLLRVLEIGTEIGPVGPPGLGGFLAFLVPALLKGVQSIQGCLLVYSGIDRLQVGHKCLQVPYLLELRSWWIMQS